MSEAPLSRARSPKTDEERKAALNEKIQQSIVLGSRVESQGDFQAVLVRGRRPNHVLHLLLSIVTVGLWLIIWVLLVIGGGERRALFTVDEYGNVNVRNIKRS